MLSDSQPLSPWPFYSLDEQNAAIEVLKSGRVNYWTGEKTNLFEEAFSNYLSKDKFKSIALANGSVALSAAYRSLSLVEGSEVITTPRTFIATSSELLNIKAIPIFADVDINSGCITAKTIEPLITKKTKAISVVHLGGWPAEMFEICELAKAFNLKIIEDCSQAHGATINNKSVGTFGDISTWSFCQDKIISTGGEGGLISTQSSKLWKSIWSYKDHGKNRDEIFRKDQPSGYKWVHDDIGTNLRMTEFQSAIGIIQLKKLIEWRNIREKNALTFVKNLIDIPCIRISLPPENIKHAWYKFYCYVDETALLSGWNRNRILYEINQLGYPAFQGSCGEIYLEKCFVSLGLGPSSRLECSKKLSDTSLMFLIHPTITNDELKSYISVVRKIVLKASK